MLLSMRSSPLKFPTESQLYTAALRPLMRLRRIRFPFFMFVAAPLLGLATASAVRQATRKSSAAQSRTGTMQATDDFSIIAPSDGAIVHPGDTISIEVRVKPGVNVQTMAITSPLGFGAGIRMSPPYTFTLRIPTDETGMSGPMLGKQSITAVAVLGGADQRLSSAITVDVEETSLPTHLAELDSHRPQLIFDSIGEALPLIILGQFAGGPTLEVNRSTHFSFTTSNAAIATVDNYGMVTAKGPGSALITAIYSDNGQHLQLSVPVSLPYLALDVSPSSLDFGSQAIGTQSAPQYVTLTNRTNSPMKILTLAVPPVFSETNNCLNTTLSPGATCTVSVTFTPKNTLSVAGSALSIANDFDAVETKVALSGTGH